MNTELITGLLTAGIGYPIVAAVAYFAGVFHGVQKMLEKQKAASEQAIQDREKIDEEIAKRPDEKLDKDIEKWFRD